MANNGISTAADFRSAALAEAFEEPRRVVLPKSGFAVILRRPRPLAFTLLRHPLPQSLASRILKNGDSEFGVRGSGGTSSQPRNPNPETGTPNLVFSPDELVALSQRVTEMLSLVFVEPKLSLHPGPAEIHPSWLPAEDQTFIFRWIGGEVSADGGDLTGFRRGDERSGSDTGGAGGDVEVPTLRAAEGTDIRLST